MAFLPLKARDCSLTIHCPGCLGTRSLTQRSAWDTRCLA